MNSFDDNDWTDSETQLLASLREDQPRLPGHEDATVRALHRFQLLHKPIRFNWLRPLQLVGAAAAIGLAFVAGTQYQKQQEPIVERVLVPVRAEQPIQAAFVVANYDLMDESFSPANSHPKDRMSRSHRRNP